MRAVIRNLGTVFNLVLSTGGCFFGSKAPDTDSDADWSGDVPLHVNNHHWLDVTIYVIHDGQRTRVGVAGGTAETQMVLPSRLLGVGRDIQLYGDPIGSSEQAITEVLLIQPGQFIEWSLEWGLERSTVAVY
jgi:hypothetical protein